MKQVLFLIIVFIEFVQVCITSKTILVREDDKVSKGEKIRNQYNQVPHLTQDTNWKVSNSQLYTTNESREVSPFPAGDHKAQINRRAQRHTNTRQKKRSKKKYHLGTVSKIFYWKAKTGFTVPTSPLIQMKIKTHIYLVCMKDP